MVFVKNYSQTPLASPRRDFHTVVSSLQTVGFRATCPAPPLARVIGMRNATAHLHEVSLKHAVKHRVERDIAALHRKSMLLENSPQSNDQLLAAYRMMLATRTDVLNCLLDTMASGERQQRRGGDYESGSSSMQ